MPDASLPNRPRPQTLRWLTLTLTVAKISPRTFAATAVHASPTRRCRKARQAAYSRVRCTYTAMTSPCLSHEATIASKILMLARISSRVKR